MIPQALLPLTGNDVVTRPARIRQVPKGQHYNKVLKQGARTVYLVCEGEVTIGEVREYYANQVVGEAGIDQLDVAVTDDKGSKTYPAAKAAPILVTPQMRTIEFKQPAGAKG